MELGMEASLLNRDDGEEAFRLQLDRVKNLN